MRNIYLLRHGQSEWNISGKVQGSKDSLLTDKGIDQARCAASRLKSENIDIIYASPLTRAKKTAELIGSELGVDVRIEDKLQEMCFGHWEGQFESDVERDYGDEFLKWKREPHLFQIEGSETLVDVQARMLSTVEKIEKNDSSKNVLIVSHGTALKSLILGLLDIDLAKYGNFSIGNTGISKIEFGDYNRVMRFFNDTNHITD